MLKKIFTLFVLFILFVSFTFSELPEEAKKDKKQLNKTTVLNQWRKIALNNLEMWFSNNGGSSDLTFPKNSGKGVIYSDGPILSGMQGTDIRMQGRSNRPSSLQAGQSFEGVDPSDPQYRIYMVRKDWKNLPDNMEFYSGPNYTKADYNRDYNEWPIDMGAPYEILNGNRVPRFIGDEQAWYVMNDLTPPDNFYGTSPSGTEWQALVWAYNMTGPLANVIFKKHTIIHKGTKPFENTYLTYMSDPDLGDAADDLIGCDTVLQMGYVYNGGANDAIYGSDCPAAGYIFLQGPMVRTGEPNDIANWNFGTKKGYKNLPMTSFNFTINGDPYYSDPVYDYAGAVELYNLIQGKKKQGTEWINEVTNEVTTFPFSGDPVARTGWNDNTGIFRPRDVRLMLSSGPFTLAVGDTQELVVGIVVGQGADRLSSITVMKNYAILAQKTYDDLCASTTTVINKPKEIPSDYSLSQNYPNPFNPTTTIQYSIPKDEHVKLIIYDITGKVVKELVNGHKVAGIYNVIFNASGYASGTYYYKLEAGEYKSVQKMMLVK